MTNRKPYGDKAPIKDLRRAVYSIAANINAARRGEGVAKPLDCRSENIPDFTTGDEALDRVHWNKVYRRLYRKARRYGVPIDYSWPKTTTLINRKSTDVDTEN
jgi:hypothetical protein